MEYENMRMPELKSIARDRGLRSYSRMRKAELVAFLTIWAQTIFRCVGTKGPPINLRDISMCGEKQNMANGNILLILGNH